MSLILDALQRADADRERGAVPGLHTHQSPPPSASLTPARRAAALPWLLGAAVLALTAGAGWWFGAAGKTGSAPAIAAAAPPEPTAPAPAPAPAATPTTPANTAPASASMAPASTPTLAALPDHPPAAPPTATTTPGPREIDRVAIEAPSVRAKAPPEIRTDPAAKAVESTAAKPLTNADSPAKIPAANELPPDIRQRLPKLAISGSTYSQNPAHRMLIMQGQVFKEGDKLAPDWTLERIEPKTVVLNFRGQRYQVAH